MRSDFFQERESDTKIYFKPAPEIQAWAPRQSAPMQWMAAPPRRLPVATRTEMVTRAPTRRLPMIGIGFAGVCVLIGITLGCMISGGSSSNAVAAPVAAKPVAAPVAVVPAPVAPIATPIAVAPVAVAPVVVVPPSPAPVNVRVESTPPGATVMRLEHGQTVIIGQTPIDMMLDAATPSDLILDLDGYAPQTAHVDPATQHPSVQAMLVAVAPVVAAPVVAAPIAPAPAHHHHAAPAHAPAADDDAAMGTLKVSAKPPCKIVIDGKPTGLTTPQVAIELTPGTHQVTLVNAAEGIDLTTAVRITADHATPLIQDFTK